MPTAPQKHAITNPKAILRTYVVRVPLYQKFSPLVPRIFVPVITDIWRLAYIMGNTLEQVRMKYACLCSSQHLIGHDQLAKVRILAHQCGVNLRPSSDAFSATENRNVQLVMTHYWRMLCPTT